PFDSSATAPPDTYSLSLHDALPICTHRVQLRALTVQVQGESRVDSGELSGEPGQGELVREARDRKLLEPCGGPEALAGRAARIRSEEHTSELQSLAYLVCRLLLEKK